MCTFSQLLTAKVRANPVVWNAWMGLSTPLLRAWWHSLEGFDWTKPNFVLEGFDWTKRIFVLEGFEWTKQIIVLVGFDWIKPIFVMETAGNGVEKSSATLGHRLKFT
jgi:hypothetical protein